MIVTLHYPYSARSRALCSTSENNSHIPIRSFIFICSVAGAIPLSLVPSNIPLSPQTVIEQYWVAVHPVNYSRFQTATCTSSDIEQGQCGFVIISMSSRHKRVKKRKPLHCRDAACYSNTCLYHKAQHSSYLSLCWQHTSTGKLTRTTKAQNRC